MGEAAGTGGTLTLLERSTHSEPLTPDGAIGGSYGALAAVEALARDAAAAGDVVSAQLWLRDDRTDSFRQLASTDTCHPSAEPVPVRGGSFDRVYSSDEAAIVAVADDDPISPSDMWRLLLPLSVDRWHGIAVVAFDGRHPDAGALDAVSMAHLPGLRAALAVTLASQEAELATSIVTAARALVEATDDEAVATRLLAGAVALMGAHTGSVMLLGDDGELRVAAAHGLPACVTDSAVARTGDGVAGWVHATGRPVVIEDTASRGPQGRRHGVRSALSVPICDADGPLGVLNVGSRVWPARSVGALLASLETLCELGATALRSAQASESVRGLYFETLTALVIGLETKDPFAHGATDRVVELTTAMGADLDLAPADAEALRIASLLHDIGMSAAGDVVALSSRPLSTVERTLLKMHPLIAADILRQVPALERVVPIVFHHHEHYDGRGYVAGLTGEAIPLGARILAVADAYVAMTSDRPYRRARTPEDALRELRAHAGTQFDPVVVEVLAGHLANKEERPPRGTAVEFDLS